MQITQTILALTTSATIVGVGGVESWMAFAEKFGIVAALLLYFVYRDYQTNKAQGIREVALILRIRKLEDEYRTLLKTTVDNNTAAMQRCETRAMRHG